MGTPADKEVGFVYPVGGGNDIGVYKQPQPNTLDDNIQVARDPNTYNASESSVGVPARRVSIGRNTDIKSNGVETRGNGAAIKGRTARGPMA